MWDDLKTRCDRIEECYEFALAYAAQGLSGDEGAASTGEMREYLRRSMAALDGLAGVLTAIVERERLQPAETYHAFIDVLGADARTAGAAMALAGAQPILSSQLVDNLNASIHVRALLTDLFLIDEIIKAHLAKAKP